jgi:NADH-quinone oxidoreductase subunit N
MLLAMGGLPLTSGFVAKFGVFQAAWRTDRYEWLVLLGVLTSVAAFAFYLRVIMVMYMQEPDAPGRLLLPLPTRWVLGVATLATVFFGVLPAPLLDLAADAIQLPL